MFLFVLSVAISLLLAGKIHGDSRCNFTAIGEAMNARFAQVVKRVKRG